MRNLLAIWREHGIDLLLREAAERRSDVLVSERHHALGRQAGAGGRVVSSRPQARAYRVQRGGGGAIKTAIVPELLAAAGWGLERDVPADIREFRAERYRAAGRR